MSHLLLLQASQTNNKWDIEAGSAGHPNAT